MRFRLWQIVESFEHTFFFSEKGIIRQSKKKTPLKELTWGQKPLVEGEDYFINPTEEEIREVGRSGELRFIALIPEKKLYIFYSETESHITFVQKVFKQSMDKLMKSFYSYKVFAGVAKISNGRAIVTSSDSFRSLKDYGMDFVSFANILQEDNKWLSRYIDCGPYLKKMIRKQKNSLE